MAAPPDSRLVAPWRPVQYLGNKQRVIPAIIDAVSELVGPGPVDIVDAFSGSSVVTQALAMRGHRVTAIDASPAAALLARATTGGPSDKHRLKSLPACLAAARDEARAVFERACVPWNSDLERESVALRERDGAELAVLAARLPQIWRDLSGVAPSITSVFRSRQEASQDKTPYPPSLLSAVFAGTYFGLRQALIMEAYLTAGHAAWHRGDLPDWEFDCLRASVLYAASRATFSAGKHFAQPHRLGGDKMLTFHYKRLIQDRGVDIDAAMAAAGQSLSSVALAIKQPATVYCEPVETAAVAFKSAAVVYADPPYTAQQYSRFYHVLDLIADGRAQTLQAGTRGSGEFTRGLYPAERYLSDFCRTTTAPLALHALAARAKEVGASLILSYSVSPRASGNARVIPLERLIGTVRSVYGRAPDVREVPLTYRSFNNRRVATSADRELLVVARAA